MADGADSNDLNVFVNCSGAKPSTQGMDRYKGDQVRS